MDRYTVEYLPAALDDISSILTYVSQSSQNRITALRYIKASFARCERIADAPFGGVARPELGSDLRMAVFERSVVILYFVEERMAVSPTSSPAARTTKPCCAAIANTPIR
jgi:toxin ParE1/3/4